MSALVPGFWCWDHVNEPVLWCYECMVLWSHCCGERHVCPPEVQAARVERLRQGDWVEVEPAT